MQRFTPRRPGSNWSKVNVAKVAKLKEAGLMRPAGTAFELPHGGEDRGLLVRERGELSAEYERGCAPTRPRRTTSTRGRPGTAAPPSTW